MRKVFFFVSILSFLCLLFPKSTQAQYSANKFGIHILEPADLEKAEELVNSSGGDWGWVTTVIRDDDLNIDKWQSFMDNCREKHLIPLVRIATHLEGDCWAKPKEEDSEKWVNFLNSLNWPVATQYVIVFNEPNQAKEWGGELSPGEYARILFKFSKDLHAKNKNFKVLNAGLDLAAPNSKSTQDALYFLREMKSEIPDIFEAIDGWSSHSYPNHGYLGKPWESGKTSIRGYSWELSFLKNTLGVDKDLPVFITETGWPKKSSLQKKNLYYDSNITAEYIKYAFENVWLNDSRVVAITPFVLNYPDSLFADFSWLDMQGSPYPQFDTVKTIAKSYLWPPQDTKIEVLKILLPPFLPANTLFVGKITLKNTGQSIWGEEEFKEIPSQTQGNISLSTLIVPQSTKIKPGEKITLEFGVLSSSQSGEFKITWEGLPEYNLRVTPESFLNVAKFTLWQKIISFFRK